MAKLISKTYGEALYELAIEENKVDSFAEEIEVLRKILAESKDLNSLMNHPKIAKEEKLQVMKRVFEGRLDNELLGFLSLIITKDRYGEVDNILRYFLDQVKELKGIGVASVASATPLNLAIMRRNCPFDRPMDRMTANSRRRRMRLFVTVLNTFAMAMSARMTVNNRQNTRTMVASILLLSCMDA